MCKEQNCNPSTLRISDNLLTLGLDIHTKSIGFAVVSGWTGQAVRHGLIDLHHLEPADAFDKVDYVRERLLKLKLDTEYLYKQFIGVDKEIRWAVGVEAYLFRFLLGQSRAISIFSLAEFNTLVSYECRWIFQKRPFQFHASKARSWLGIKNRKESKDIKQVVFERVQPFLLGFQTRYRPRSKAFCSTNFDISDAYVAARYAIRLEEEKLLLKDKQLLERITKETTVSTTLHRTKRSVGQPAEALQLSQKEIEALLRTLESERIETSQSEIGQQLTCFIKEYDNESGERNSSS
eukprot:jgi/Galph1/4215/GphlegSOOS_G2812.1